MVTTDWGGGFCADITVTNPGPAVAGWTLEFDYPYSITSIWNARIVSHVGDRYVIGNAGWNAAVPGGGAVSFGFCGTPGNALAVPAHATFSDLPVALGD